MNALLNQLDGFTDDEIKTEFARRFKKTKARFPDVSREPCSVPYEGPRPKTPAQAAKIRKERMEMCGCHLCYDALRPAMTFIEQARRMGRPFPPHDPMADLEAA